MTTTLNFARKALRGSSAMGAIALLGAGTIFAAPAFAQTTALDPVTYGAYLYNAVQAGNGIYGRSFRAGAKFGF